MQGHATYTQSCLDRQAAMSTLPHSPIKFFSVTLRDIDFSWTTFLHIGQDKVEVPPCPPTLSAAMQSWHTVCPHGRDIGALSPVRKEKHTGHSHALKSLSAAIIILSESRVNSE